MGSESAAVRHPAAAGKRVPSATVLLLMAAQALIAAPQAWHQPGWVTLVVIVCVGWRAAILFRRWPAPPWVAKWCLVGLVCGAVALDPRPLFSVDTAAALLLVAFALKLLELRSRRDAYVVMFLAYFVIATGFLFDQSIGMAIYYVAAIVIVTAAIATLNQTPAVPRLGPALRIACVLLLQAVPLMVVTFLFFPRVAPLWTVPLPDAAVTGVSDRVRPGDIAELARSDQIAFRVVFDGDTPIPRNLYWRGLVYSHYADGTWRQDPASHPATAVARSLLPGTDLLRYQVLMEPTYSRWLFALDAARPLSPGIEVTSDHRLTARDPVRARLTYQVESDPAASLDAMLSDSHQERERQLPPGTNPRSRAFAEALFAEYEYAPAAFADALLSHIRQQPYFYTLSPPRTVGAHDIDSFWFDTRRGFCAHYAGAFVFMMRAAGIPARMVGGYQGGTFNARSGHLVVRQYDAHAWAEWWQAGTGWVRVDPTAAVAPARIEAGLDAALSAHDRASLPLLTYARFGYPAFADLLSIFEALEHRWNLWVLGYDPQIQARLLGALTPARIALALTIGGGATLGLVAVLLFRRSQARSHPAIAVMRRFSRSLRRRGLERRPGETLDAWFARIEAAAPATMGTDQLLADLETALYNSGGGAARRQWTLAFWQLRLRLFFRFGDAHSTDV
jgi:protein-glutamine gamma-glutamyltransferase